MTSLDLSQIFCQFQGFVKRFHGSSTHRADTTVDVQTGKTKIATGTSKKTLTEPHEIVFQT